MDIMNESFRPMPEQQGPKKFEGFAGLVARQQERLLNTPEMAGVRDWYKERAARLPEMEVTDTALTGKGGWGHEMTPEGNVDRVKGAFFEIPGQQITITKSDGSTMGWNQPGIVQKETSITLPSPYGEMTLDASGFVGILQDMEGKVLLTVGQEPLANTDKKALARTPFQTSAAKLQALMEGDTSKDPNLAGVLEKVGGGRPVSELFAAGDVDTFPLAPADPNRIAATNIGFSMKVQDSEIAKALEADGANRWCTREEAKALTKTGLVNGHTAAALLAV